MTLETLKNPTQVEPEQQETVKRLKQVLGSMRLDREKGITVVVPKTPSSDFVDMFAILETALAPYLNDPFNPNRERAIRLP